MKTNTSLAVVACIAVIVGVIFFTVKTTDMVMPDNGTTSSNTNPKAKIIDDQNELCEYEGDIAKCGDLIINLHFTDDDFNTHVGAVKNRVVSLGGKILNQDEALGIIHTNFDTSTDLLIIKEQILEIRAVNFVTYNGLEIFESVPSGGTIRNQE